MVRILTVCFGLLLSGQVVAAELTVSAAASLTNVFRDLVPLFEAEHPDIRLQLNFGASGALLQQIAKGAPVDVFASADQATMDQAQSQGLVQAQERQNFVSNRLVLIVPHNARQIPGDLQQLSQTPFSRIAIGVPASVPVGRYTQSVLEKLGLWESIAPRMIGAQSVRQALDYVARGEVDAGFVYATDAALMQNKVKIALIIPTETPVLYPIAPVSSSQQQTAARQFITFVQSAPAQAVFAKYGFGKP